MASAARILASVLSLSGLALVACKAKERAPTEAELAAAAEAEEGPVTIEEFDAGPGHERDVPRVAALDQTTTIYSAPSFPPKDAEKVTDKSPTRLGYLRRGTVVEVKPNVRKKSNCPEGWYELTTGGFVCGKSVTTDLEAKALERAPHAPYMDRPLPYDYGLNITNGAPLYRRRPYKSERAELEKGLAVGKTKKDAGAPKVSADAPWWLQNHGGKKPQLSANDIFTNERAGLVYARMVRGFYLSLDKSVSGPSGRFWHTVADYYAPSDHILVHKPVTEFEGVRLGAEGETRRLPLGWVVSPRARRYTIEDGDPTRADEKDGKLRRGESVSRFTIAQLTGKSKTIEGRGYFETEEGWWLRDIDAAVTRPGPPPKGLAPGEKWIDINVSTQSLIAYEGDKPVYATIVSTGRSEYPTVLGEFRVRDKHIAATMSDEEAEDGAYSIQDVPWILYFQGGYAIHGAFWHSSFGRVRSHGCVNMTPHDAKQIFDWVSPTLPPGWHGMRATAEDPGTRIVVHEDPKPAGASGSSSSRATPKSDKREKSATRDKPDKRERGGGSGDGAAGKGSGGARKGR